MATDVVKDFQEVAGQLSKLIDDPKVSYFDKVGILTDYWLGRVGALPQKFDYAQPFAPTAPDCAPKFQAKFHHKPWVDGEDPVQAGETPTEQGFNTRLSNIQLDIGQLAADQVTQYACLVTLRGQLRNLLDEIRAEINRLHAAVYDLKAAQPAGGFGGAGGIKVIDKNKFRGLVTINNQKFHMWEGDGGLIVLPPIQAVADAAGPILRDGPVAIRDLNPAVIGRFFTDRGDPALFATQPTKADLITKYGDSILDDGRPVRDALAPLPANTPFGSAQEVVGTLARVAADSLRVTPAATELVARNFKKDPAGLPELEKVPVTDTTFVSPALATALTAARVATVGDLAKLTPDKLVAVAREQRVAVSLAEAADAIASAGVLRNLR